MSTHVAVCRSCDLVVVIIVDVVVVVVVDVVVVVVVAVVVAVEVLCTRSCCYCCAVQVRFFGLCVYSSTELLH